MTLIKAVVFIAFSVTVSLMIAEMLTRKKEVEMATITIPKNCTGQMTFCFHEQAGIYLEVVAIKEQSGEVHSKKAFPIALRN